MWAMSFCTCIGIFSRLHSCIEIFTSGMFRGKDMCLGPLFWVKKSFFCMMFSCSVFCVLVKNVSIIFVMCCMTLGYYRGTILFVGVFIIISCTIE